MLTMVKLPDAVWATALKKPIVKAKPKLPKNTVNPKNIGLSILGLNKK